MNEGQQAALLQEVMALRLVLVHLLARQPPGDLAAISAGIDAELAKSHPDVATALIPFRATVDELLAEAAALRR